MRPHPAKSLIIAEGHTIKSVAKDVGVNAVTFGQILNRHRDPWPALRQRLSERLSRPESELFFGDGEGDARVSAAAEALVKRTCEAQGLPTAITDPSVIDRVAVLVAPARDTAKAGR